MNILRYKYRYYRNEYEYTLELEELVDNYMLLLLEQAL